MQSKNKNWGFIGCGNLAQAIITGALAKRALRPSQIIAVDQSAEKLKAFSKKTKIKTAYAPSELFGSCDFIVLATKPQDLGPVVDEISLLGANDINGPVVVSLAAGVSLKSLRKKLPQASAVIRIMANTPAQVQRGLFGTYFDFEKSLSSAHRIKIKSLVEKVFSALGVVIELHSDNDIDAITSASASGVGFVFEFMRIFEKWLIHQNYSTGSARTVAIETFLGASLLASERPDQSLEDLRNAVTSKKGTTLAGLQSMKRQKLEKVFSKTLTAAKSRARALSKAFK